MIIITHHGSEHATPIAVTKDNTDVERINQLIIESFIDWTCPPEDNCTLIRDADGDIYIKHEGDYIDYDGDGYFSVKNVPLR